MNNKKVEEYLNKTHSLDYNCVTVNEMQELIKMRADIVIECSHNNEELPKGVANNGEMELCKVFMNTISDSRYPNGLPNDFVVHNGIIEVGSVLCCEDEEGKVVFVTLFKNGNDYKTIVSFESLQPICDYIRYVESCDEATAFISGASHIGDEYYYCVTTIFEF